MRFWDNDKDRQFDEAIDALFWEAKAHEAQQNTNISNPVALIGAQ